MDQDRGTSITRKILVGVKLVLSFQHSGNRTLIEISSYNKRLVVPSLFLSAYTF